MLKYINYRTKKIYIIYIHKKIYELILKNILENYNILKKLLINYLLILPVKSLKKKI